MEVYVNCFHLVWWFILIFHLLWSVARHVQKGQWGLDKFLLLARTFSFTIHVIFFLKFLIKISLDSSSISGWCCLNHLVSMKLVNSWCAYQVLLMLKFTTYLLVTIWYQLTSICVWSFDFQEINIDQAKSNTAKRLCSIVWALS